MRTDDSDFMMQAFYEGLLAVGQSRPNPAVGALVVKNEQIVGRGHTQEPGYSHAEVMALKEAKENAVGADLYVTLEPCVHYGRTPPCVNAIIESQINRVFFAHEDKNPIVFGKAKKILENAGIQVFSGKKACKESTFSKIETYFEAYDYFVSTNRTFVELKIATTKNGFIANKDLSPLKITGEKANRQTHEWRAMSDAILVSSNTVLHDNPLLNVRFIKGNNPIKILWNFQKEWTNTELSELKIFKETPKENILIFSFAPQRHAEKYFKVVPLPSENFKENWEFLLSYLSDLKMHRLFVEPGAFLLENILKTKLWNKLYHLESKAEIIVDGKPIKSKMPDQYLKKTQDLETDILEIYENDFLK